MKENKRRESPSLRVAVDLTPVLPGGDNGGAKFFSTRLLWHLSRITPDWDYVLLTSAGAHGELAWLDGSNVRRLCVAGAESKQVRPEDLMRGLWGGLAHVARRLASLLPAPARSAAIGVRARFSRPGGRLLRDLGADVLFCPFTAPTFFDPTVRTVSVVHDLQYADYPQFFSPQERSLRDRTFNGAAQLSERIVCVSEFTRRAVLKRAAVEPSRVQVIHPRQFCRLEAPTEDQVRLTLERLSLTHSPFLLYPANFWPHKNHRMLFTAFRMFQARHPNSELQLVLTGAPGIAMTRLAEEAEGMGLASHIVFAGYVDDQAYAALVKSCLAMIFPSLYEGFGVPPLEAMRFHKPVLCSDVTGLPEAVGEAGLYFDPRKPRDIMAVIERVTFEDGLAEELVRRGEQRLGEIGDEWDLAASYADVLADVSSAARRGAESLHGVYPDLWTGGNVVVTYPHGAHGRSVQVTLEAPSHVADRTVSVSLSGRGHGGHHLLAPGTVLDLCVPLPPEAGFFELEIQPLFQPRADKINDDERWLGCMCQSCVISTASGQRDLLRSLSNDS